MGKYFNTEVGRLRLTGLFEGISFLLLLFIAMPMKYIGDNDMLIRPLGMAHGLLFVLFIIQTFNVASARNWKFSETTWKVLLASVLPFGTFYVDKKILSRI